MRYIYSSRDVAENHVFMLKDKEPGIQGCYSAHYEFMVLPSDVIASNKFPPLTIGDTLIILGCKPHEGDLHILTIDLLDYDEDDQD